MAKRLSLSPSVRLACQTTVDGDVSLRRFVLDADDIELTRQLTAGKTALSFGEENRVAILFSDIRGFTTLSEQLPPYDVIYGLNRYFHKMSQVVLRHRGYIDNYMGDGLMALFGVEEAEGAALRAVKAGLEMLEEVERMKQYVETVQDVSFGIRIGVHYGEAVVGAVIGIAGAIQTKRMTAIGDAVNYASRIEAANKEQGTSFLISEDTYDIVKNEIVTGKKCERVRLRGKSGAHVLYEVIGIRNPDQSPSLLQAGSREAVRTG
jgi:adenylate cyclase